MWQFTQDKNDNWSVMIQKETKWSAHLEVTEIQGYLCEIHAKKMETHRIVVWHLHKEKWESSTQKKRQKGVASTQHKGSVWNKRKKGGL